MLYSSDGSYTRRRIQYDNIVTRSMVRGIFDLNGTYLTGHREISPVWLVIIIAISAHVFYYTGDRLTAAQAETEQKTRFYNNDNNQVYRMSSFIFFKYAHIISKNVWKRAKTISDSMIQWWTSQIVDIYYNSWWPKNLCTWTTEWEKKTCI